MTLPPRSQQIWFHAWRAVLFFAVVVMALNWGLAVRSWTWEQTMRVRFTGDIDNGFRWGKTALRVGYFNVYETLGDVYEAKLRGRPFCDYAPLRLGVMSLWVRWLEKNDAPLDRRVESAAYHAPLLRFNTTMELLTTLGAFLIVRQLVRRKLDDPPFWRGVFAATVAALLTWFNPLILYNAHAWPQWDIWAMPFFFFAVYCGLNRRWLLAGLLIGVGATFKGQLLIVSWVLPVWAIVVIPWAEVWRWVVSVGSRFTSDEPTPLSYTLRKAGDDVHEIGRLMLPPLRVVIGVIAGIAIIGIPWELSRMPRVPLSELHGLNLWLGREVDFKAVAWVLCWIAAALLIPRRLSATLLCAAVAISLWTTMSYRPGNTGAELSARQPLSSIVLEKPVRVFSGTNYWLQSGFGVGTIHYNAIYMGTTSNLPALLAQRFGFRSDYYQTVNLPTWLTGAPPAAPPQPILLKTLMLVIFLSLALVAAIFAGINDRRRDPRLILAITLPWLLFYLIPLQIHERYTFYIVACTGLFAACGLGWTLLGVVITLVGLLATVHTAIGSRGIQPIGLTTALSRDPHEWFGYIHMICIGTHPGIAWLLLLAAAMILYGIMPRRERRMRMTTPDAPPDPPTAAPETPGALAALPYASADLASAGTPRSSWRLQRTIGWAILVVIVLLAAVYGMKLREWAFVATSPIRFNGDVNRGFNWGYYNFHNGYTKGRGYFETYDDAAGSDGVQDRGSHNWIDYAPLRLGVMTLWARYNHTHGFPYEARRPPQSQPSTIERELAFHHFPRMFNATMEAIGVVGAFMLVRFVVRRNREKRLLPVDHFTGVPHALAAALLLWFNPAMIQSAHTWITWDMWIVPPFLWALYFGCRKWWFCAGLVIAVGALFKGQQFFVAPMFLLWPLFQGRWKSALRFAAGLLIGFAVLTSPWTLASTYNHGPRYWVKPSLAYATCVLLAVVALPLVRRLVLRKVGDNKQIWWAITFTAGIAGFALTVWPAYGHAPMQSYAGMGALGLALLCAAASSVIPLRALPVLAAGCVGAAMLLGTPLFHLNYAWFDASYLYGTNHWEKNTMVMGLSDNLPGILANRYGWRDPLDVVFAWRGYGSFDFTSNAAIPPTDGSFAVLVTMKKLLFSIFLVLMVISSAGVAMHDRRASTRFLVAVIAPWLLFFTFPAQIHERYLLFGAAAAAICIGHSVGMTLLGLFLSILATLMPLHVMLSAGNRNQFRTEAWPTMGPDLFWFLQGTFPELGWAVILATLVFFYFAVTPVWVRRRREVRVERMP